MKKIFIFLIGIIVIFLFILKVKQMNNQKYNYQNGMFEWSEEAIYDVSTVLDLSKELKITKWYQEISDDIDVDAMKKFTKTLHEEDINIYALLGSVEWGLEKDGNSIITYLEKLVDYNNAVEENEKLDGIMLDIEPYITSKWKNNPEKYMERYLNSMKNVYQYAKLNDIRIIICIPRHYDEQGFENELEELIALTCDEVAVMNYGCGDEVERIETEAKLAEKYDKPLHCILEFQEVGKHGLTEDETYRNKGIGAAEEVWDKVQQQYHKIDIIRDYHWSDPIKKMLEEG